MPASHTSFLRMRNHSRTIKNSKEHSTISGRFFKAALGAAPIGRSGLALIESLKGKTN